MAKKKKPKNKRPSKKYTKYKVENDRIIRKPSCPKCGDGIFLGDHKTRLLCGRCGYVEFKSKKTE